MMNYYYDMMYPAQNGLDSAYGSGILPTWGVFIALFGIISIALLVFQVWLFFRIFSKAGYNGWMSLLSLIPWVGMFVCLLILAFDTWPRDPYNAHMPHPHHQRHHDMGNAPMGYSGSAPVSSPAPGAAPHHHVDSGEQLAKTPSPGEEAMYIAEQTVSEVERQ